MSGNPIVAEVLTVARKLNNYEIDPATGLKVLWTTTQVYEATVPSGKRWFLVGGFVYRNVSSTVVINIRDTTPVIIDRLLDETAATGGKAYPEADFQMGQYRVLDAGEQIRAEFGVAQNAGSWMTAMVLEVDV